MSQVSVSEQVRSLEDRLGTALFVRRSGGAPQLTDAGRIALLRAEQVLAIVADLEREMDPTAGRRPLRLAVQPFLLREPATILEWIDRHRSSLAIDLEIGTRSEADLARRVDEGSLDAAFFFSFGRAASPEALHLYDEPLAIFAGRDHPLSALPSVSIADLVGQRAVGLTAGNPLGELVRHAMADAGIGNPPTELSSDEFGLIVSSVADGIGYACLFAASTEACERMGLVRIPLDQELPALRVNVLIRTALRGDPEMTAFIDLLKTTWERSPVITGLATSCARRAPGIPA